MATRERCLVCRKAFKPAIDGQNCCTSKCGLAIQLIDEVVRVREALRLRLESAYRGSQQ